MFILYINNYYNYLFIVFFGGKKKEKYIFCGLKRN